MMDVTSFSSEVGRGLKVGMHCIRNTVGVPKVYFLSLGVREKPAGVSFLWFLGTGCSFLNSTAVSCFRSRLAGFMYLKELHENAVLNAVQQWTRSHIPQDCPQKPKRVENTSWALNRVIIHNEECDGDDTNEDHSAESSYSRVELNTTSGKNCHAPKLSPISQAGTPPRSPLFYPKIFVQELFHLLIPSAFAVLRIQAHDL